MEKTRNWQVNFDRKVVTLKMYSSKKKKKKQRGVTLELFGALYLWD